MLARVNDRSMKAIVRDDYGGPEVLKLEAVPVPVPKPDEVLLRVRASSLNRGDRYMLQGIPVPLRLVTGPLKPKRRGLGMDLAGDVVAIGSDVTDVRVGDAVYGQTDFGEAWAELASVPARLVAPKPPSLTYEEAAAVPLAGMTALQGLKQHGRLEPGQRVLINGATGAVGSFAVQIAKALGADVTAVCGERNAERVRGWGADRVIPYETEDFTASGERFDVLFDVAGAVPLRACLRVLEPKGTYVAVGAPGEGALGPMGHFLAVLVQAPFVRQRVATCSQVPSRADLVQLTTLIEAKKVRPVLSRTFTLARTADALRYLMTERPYGKVAIAIE